MKNLMVLATLLVANALWPRVASAMEIPQFDRMAKEDQQHYVTFLVKKAQELLIEQGHRDLALKIALLFQEIPAGESQSVGEAQFEMQLATARPWSTKMNFEVESVLRRENVLRTAPHSKLAPGSLSCSPQR